MDRNEDLKMEFQHVNNISLQFNEYTASKNVIFTSCNKTSGINFLETAMLSGKFYSKMVALI